MKRFFCQCGQEVFFENKYCSNCTQSLGFDVKSLDLITIEPIDSTLFVDSGGRHFRLCGNELDFDVCNWLVPHESAQRLCFACQFNRTIPNQKVTDVNPPINYFRWYRLEDAKKRVIYTLLSIGVNLNSGWSDKESGLLFDFLESESNGGSEKTKVNTGYAGGIITINSLEADDVARTQARTHLKERQRTILGHFRHELAHYLWDKYFYELPMSRYFSDFFGEEKCDYRESLDIYYENGPPKNWPENYISAYASAHPSEDWAETFNHYLLIFECLDTAQHIGMSTTPPQGLRSEELIDAWRELAVKLNQVNRSIGLSDAYPFVITGQIEVKLNYVASIISEFRDAQIKK